MVCSHSFSWQINRKQGVWGFYLAKAEQLYRCREHTRAPIQIKEFGGDSLNIDQRD